MRLVIKYGGTSISSAKDIRAVANHLNSLSKKNQIIVVCSATSGTTDDLIEISESIKKENKSKAEQLASKITNRHKQLAKQTIKKTDLRKKLLKNFDDDFAELVALIDGMVLLGEVTPRTMDYLFSFGERLSIKLVSMAISDSGKKSVPLTGKEVGIVTDSNFGESKPLIDTTRLRVSKTVENLFSKKTIPVVGGFVGADQHGHITTFGRGGSDYSATIIGTCIKADEIWLMSDVDGLMTADPKIVKNAKLLKEVSYIEAIEMALFGAKQIHPRTFEPLLSKKIPMKIRSSFNIKNEGTLVTASPSSSVKNTVKCVSNIRNNGLIDIQGGSMVGTPGTAAKIFATLAKAGINVMMISQNPSESSITIVVKNTDLDKAVSSLEMELLGKIIKKLEVTTNVAIIALIGSGMRGTVGVASKVFGAVEKNKVNVSMITQGSSELNLAFVVKNSDTNAAVRALHNAFALDKIN
ncbi:Aspartokinase protein [Marine Group I thaumarchaeote SCGC RSA3]|uniref:Aspartokinase n=2 Tax=Marine Group I TaxID=905826 RepID=A0A087RMH5_9ARCH|nr:Bifunctional aspartokinase-homoserine dehydrogenase 1 protein [Marine Group I thaumarchaeote SCGC AAA799-D11]KFM15944.1 Aspartokinase protein [Marine Group I thaumarchaeote SCGC RSA3]